MSFIVGQRVLSASGGTISTITGYTVHTFTSSGSFTPNQNGTVEVLVVGAGGSTVLIPAPSSGPASYSGGGGGGSVIYRKLLPVGAGVSYSIEIGQINSPISTASTFTHPQGPITAPGGGSGTYTNNGFYSAGGISNPIGSGGGAAYGTYEPKIGGSGANVVGYGFSGGNGGGSGGGGGGAGGVGSASTNQKGGDGGIGVSYSITGSSLYYGVGGGGQSDAPWPGPNGYPNQNISLPIVSPYGRGKRIASPAPENPAAISDAGPGIVIIRYIN